MAFPGIRSVETAGLGAHTGATAIPDAPLADAPQSASVSDVASTGSLEVPGIDAYALRLSVTRRLYDNGIAMQGSPALRDLAEVATLTLHPSDADRLAGASTEVLVKGTHGEVVLAVKTNVQVPRGAAEIVFGARDAMGQNAVAALIDGSAITAQVRLESR
jgi:hypothetical protein